MSEDMIEARRWRSCVVGAGFYGLLMGPACV